MFEPKRIYRRRKLHELYGGQRQGGISTPADHPLIFLFTGDTGEQYGYHDGWDRDGTFRYTGEGQVGDMIFKGGNRAIRDHAADSKDLHLFEKVAKAHVRYLGQMVCAGYDLVPDVPDRTGTSRTAIAFRLIPMEASNEYGATEELEAEETLPGSKPPSRYWDSALPDLRAVAEQGPSPGLAPRQARRNVYQRSEAVRVYVLRRANGTCEGCGAPAPFVTADGRPYLEPHHTRRLSDGGPDHPAHVIALCPTCHRRAHHAADSQEFNKALIGTLRMLERTSNHELASAS
jgi:5-methylcytosine-specific restriction protein A